MGPISPEAISDAYHRDQRIMEANARQLQRLDTLYKTETDTAQLLSLATDLQSEIGKTGGDSLTPAETKKLLQIQKLAHRVKSKLGDYARGY